MWYNILVSNGVSQLCVHDFNLSKFISVWGGLAVVVSLSHIKRKDLKGVKYRTRASDTYNASSSNHLAI